MICCLWMKCGAAAPYQGCYKETLRNRQMAISPGAYNPELMTSSFCRARCGTYRWNYAGLAHGKFCFCGNSLPTFLEGDANCNIACAGDSGENCGSATHIGVYSSLMAISGLQVSSDVSTVEATPTTVTLSLGVNQGSDVAYQVDYGDDGGFTGQNETGFESRELYLPGKHSITVLASNLGGVVKKKIGVELTDPPADIDVSCDILVTFEEGQCEITVWKGSDLTMDVSVTGKPSADVTALPVADPEQSLIGLWSAVPTATSYPGSNSIYLLQEVLFPRQGRVYWLRAHVQTIGSFKLLVLSPVCSNVYCYESNSCKASCLNAAAGTHSYKCSASDSFCIGKATCDSACTASVDRFGTSTTLADRYSVTSITTLSVTGTGPQTLTPATPLNVEAGDILGIEYTSTLAGQLTLVSSSSFSDIVITPYTTSSIGVTYINTGGSSTGFRHAIQAMFTAGSKTVLKYTLSKPPGTFPISVDVTNTILSTSVSKSGTVSLVEGVDQAIIDGPVFAIKDQATIWSLLAHTGSNLTYEWNVTDGSATTFSEDLTYTFTTNGEYNITVAIYNLMSRKENMTTVSVFEIVSGLSISAPASEINTQVNFSVIMATGVQVTCEVDYGDGSAMATVPSLTAVPPSFTISHTYTWAATFSVTINCSNPVSYQVTSNSVGIASRISNLQIEQTGAVEGQTFALVWLLDSGSVDSHSVLFDGVLYNLDPAASSDAALRWSSVTLGPLPVGGYAYNITVTNAFGSVNLTGFFSVMKPIVNPTFTASMLDVTTDDIVTFSADVTSGSDVTVLVHYEDGSADDVFPPATPGDPWTGTMTITHQFISGCACAVKATFFNAATSEERTVVVTVKVGFSTIDWDLAAPEAFYLYEPPALVHFQFSSTTGIQPTDPTVLINWGDGAPTEKYNNVVFGPPGFSRQYDDTGDYTISVSMSNAFTQRNFTHIVQVIEKLQVASIESDYPKAPLNLPFTFYFALYRGDRLERTNLTWNLGDGSTSFTTQRQGQGKNGRDAMTVTYTTTTSKTVRVQAKAPLAQSLTATRTFDIIQGVDPASVVVTVSPAVQLGQPTSFTVQYNSNPVPDSATISIDVDADGIADSTVPVTSITSSGNSQTVTFTYPTDGIHNAIVSLQNDASSVSFPVSLGIYQGFSGLAAALTFEQNVPPGRPFDQNGLDNAGLKYPLDVPIKFSVSDANNAYVSLYTVTVTSGPTTFVHTSMENNFKVPFSVAGTYVLDVTAENPLFSANVAKTIELKSRLKGLQVNISNEVLIPGEPMLFQASPVGMADFSVDTCIYIDWDYFGEKFVYSEPGARCNHTDFTDATYKGTGAYLASSRLMYNYRAPGEYTMRIVADDGKGNTETASKTFSISYEPCTRPTTSIQDSRSFFYLADSFERSRYIRLRGFASINCPANLANTKSWNLYTVNDQTGEDGPAVDISSLTTNKAELYIPSRFLPLGTYKATYAMSMTAGAGVPFLGEALTYFTVVSSELLGVIVEGGMTFITVGTAQNYVLEPMRYSLDPDVDETDPQGINVVSWYCDRLDGSTPDVACIGYRSASSSTLTIQGSALTEGQTYVITVNLQKDTRTTSAELRIMIDGLTSPISTITCLPGTVCYRRSDGYTALESSRISLRCNCPSCQASAVYLWTISIQDYRWPEGLRPLKATDMMESRSISLNSQDLALEKDLFETFGINSDVFRARCDIFNGVSNSTIYTNVWLNKPPKGGNCRLEPLVATATPSAEQQWTIVCEGWQDSDGISEFHLFSYFDATEVPKEIDSFPVSGTTNVGLDERLIMPVGPPYNDYIQEIWLTVRSALNSQTTVRIATVQVLPAPSAELDYYIGHLLADPTAEFFMDVEIADQRTVTEKISAVSSMMTTESLAARSEKRFCEIPNNWITTGYGKYDRERPTPFTKIPGQCDITTQYDIDRKRNQRTQLRSKLAKASEKLLFEDTWSIQNVAGMFSQIVAEPTEVSSETQTSILDMLISMAGTLQDKDRIKHTPQEDIEEAMRSIFSTLGGVQAAAGVMGDFPSLGDLEAAEENPVWNLYDASPFAADTEPDVTNAKSYEEAMKHHSKHVHRRLNREHAVNMTLKVDDVKLKMAQLFNSFAIPGQELDLASYRVRGQMRKDFVSKFLGQTLQVSRSSAAVEIPTELRHVFSDQTIWNDSIVVLQIQENTNFPDVYSDYASTRLNGFTHFVSVDLIDEEGGSLRVSETATPIKITIPHDENAPEPETVMVENPMVTSWDRFVYHRTTLDTPGTSLHVEFELDPDVQLIVVARHGEVPVPEDGKIDHIFLVPPVLPIQPDAINPYTITLTARDVGDKVGNWWLGLRERNSSYKNFPVPTIKQIADRYQFGIVHFEHNYKVKMWSSGCYYYDTAISDWSPNGCTISEESNLHETVCLCNHLTTFTGGFVVVPNTIDWNYVFSNADFLSNPTLYISEIVIFIIFTTGFVLARRKDKLDTQQVGLAPLGDNRKEDKYFYEIQVSTGMRRGAGTNSNVYFILSGEEDETEVRMFTDSKRPIFKKGMTNGFLMAVPRSLGRINYMRVWHDNSGSGPLASWFLNCIALKDLQTDTRQIFIANKWLALEEDDGQIDRIIPIAGKEQLEDFSYHFSERSKRDFVDGHLWFSVVARPPSSRFTCVQRVACCLCLLFMTMLTNAMFYNTQGSSSTSTTSSFNFGPFSLSPSQLFIGFVSTLIVFPVNFLLVFLFRRAKPRHKRSSPLAEAFRSRAASPDLHSKSAKTKSSQIGEKPKAGGKKIPTSIDISEAPSTSASTVELTEKSKKGKALQLSWWWVIIAWIILIICTLGSAALVTFYGISFKDDQCKKWITSLIMSFFTSVFITQPLKVILTALLLSLIFKDSGDEEITEDAEDILQDASQLECLHDTMDPNTISQARPQKFAYQPPTEEQLETIRSQRLKEVRMWAVIREILAYCIFIIILLVLCHRNRGPNNFWYKDTMYRTFIKSTDTSINFEKIKYTTDFWNWARTGLLNGLIAGKYYNAYPPLRLRTYINDKTSRMLGIATLRQLRIYPGQFVYASKEQKQSNTPFVKKITRQWTLQMMNV
ncbi:hypothetical protein RRG08_003958 [Elysia crispata]|uniref:Uncharacterized protein n=1 Tax=Elysia crispata TaxID=231223 RepID=A0AAE0ZDY2_9GAST|nr:hypothetical protein RRG08_003958 [Elysia crispata]